MNTHYQRFRARLRGVLWRLIAPVSTSEDRARREVVLNVLLCATIALLGIGFLINASNRLFGDPQTYANNAIPWYYVGALLAFFVGLYGLARRGASLVASYVLLSVYYFLGAYMSYVWGVDLPTALLFQILTIIMAGILVSGRFSLIITALITGTIGVINYYQSLGAITPNGYWREHAWDLSDVAMSGIIFLIIAGICLLYNREVEQALTRAESSERALTHERDNLEETVRQRTQEVKTAQMKQMEYLYRSAEFGRLSSGLFHDLMNLLTALSLNVERAFSERDELLRLRGHLETVATASKRLNYFVDGIRKQLTQEAIRRAFSLNHEINQIVSLLAHRTRQSNVLIAFEAQQEIELYGDSVRFGHVIANLLLNAVDAYTDAPADAKRQVRVSAREQDGMVTLTVADSGCGISADAQARIFEPFFTTKSTAKGTGIGLSLAKHIIEKEFSGTIRVDSKEGCGAAFIIQLPLRAYVASSLDSHSAPIDPRTGSERDVLNAGRQSVSPRDIAHPDEPVLPGAAG